MLKSILCILVFVVVSAVARKPSVCSSPIRCSCSSSVVNCIGKRNLKVLPNLNGTSYTELYLSRSSLEKLTCAQLPGQIEFVDVRHCSKLRVRDICALKECPKLDPQRAVFLHDSVACDGNSSTSSQGPPSSTTLAPSTTGNSGSKSSPVTIKPSNPSSSATTLGAPIVSTPAAVTPETTVEVVTNSVYDTFNLSLKATNETATISSILSDERLITISINISEIIFTATTAPFESENVSVAFNASDSYSNTSATLSDGAQLISSMLNFTSNVTFSARKAEKGGASKGLVIGLSAFGTVVTLLGFGGSAALYYWHRKKMSEQSRRYTITMANLFGEARREMFERNRSGGGVEVVEMGVRREEEAAADVDLESGVSNPSSSQITTRAQVHRSDTQFFDCAVEEADADGPFHNMDLSVDEESTL